MATGKDSPRPRRKKTSSKPQTDDGVDYEGTIIHVTWGKEHVQPVRFQGMDIGPYSMDVLVMGDWLVRRFK